MNRALTPYFFFTLSKSYTHHPVHRAIHTYDTRDTLIIDYLEICVHLFVTHTTQRVTLQKSEIYSSPRLGERYSPKVASHKERSTPIESTQQLKKESKSKKRSAKQKGKW